MKNLEEYLRESLSDTRQKACKSISDFRKQMPEKEMLKVFKFLELDTNNARYAFNKKLFNGGIYNEIDDALGNGWNSHVEAIKIYNNKVYFDVYVQGDSTDDNEDVSYDEFTKTSGDVEVKSDIANAIAIYSEKTRLKILNNIYECLSDAVDGQEVFI